MSRPDSTEYAPYFGRYIDLVTEPEILSVLEEQIAPMRSLAARAASRELFAYEPGKWTVRQVAGHVTDTERVFGYRALVFGRLDQNELPGFDENAYVEHARFNDIPLADLIDEFVFVREGHLRYLRGLPAAAWRASGVANGRRITVHALAYLMAGHVRHHLKGLGEKYGI